MPRVDFAIVVIILFVIAVWGVLPGLVIGVVLGVLVFVVTYSRTGAVKHELSGGTYTSNVDRSPEVRACLEKQGERLYILVLQGFLFFGTTSGLLDHIHRRISDSARPAARFIVLDFHLVSGVDASITLSFAKLRKLAETHELSIVLTGPSQEVEKSLREVDVGPQGTVFLVFPDLDRGVEWCEDEIVRTEVGIGGEGRPLVDQLAAQLHEEDMAGRLMGYLERIEVPAGYRILRQGTPSDDMYLVESGQMSVLLEPPGGRTVRLRTIAAGALFGEIGFFLGTPRTASVVTTMPSVVYRFSQRALADMQEQDPPLAMALTELIVRMLGERVTNANKTIAALLR